MSIFIHDPEFREYATRLAVAIVCGTLIGAERQWRGRNAGLRTNVLVAVGSAIFTYLSRLHFGSAADSSRVAAQIVSGIGFLGAGVIMRREDGVHGLNTATTIWTASALGMAAGVGAYDVALLSTLALLGIQILYRPLSASIDSLSARNEPRSGYLFTVVSDGDAVSSIQELVHSATEEHALQLTGRRLTTTREGKISAQFAIQATSTQIASVERVFPSLLERPDVHDVSWRKEEPAVLSRFLKLGRRPL